MLSLWVDRHDAIEIRLGKPVADDNQLAVRGALIDGQIGCAGEGNFVFLDLPFFSFQVGEITPIHQQDMVESHMQRQEEADARRSESCVRQPRAGLEQNAKR